MIITEEKLKNYFLGNLESAEADFLEEYCAADEQLIEQAQMIESELVDDYLRGSLSAVERRSFNENYLITETRREKLRKARMLWNLTAEKDVLTNNPAPTFFDKFYANRRLSFFGALTAAVFGLIFFGVFWIGHDKNSEVVQQTESSRSTNSAVENSDGAARGENILNRNLNTSVSSANVDPRNGGNKNLPKTKIAPQPTKTPKLEAAPPQTALSFILFPETLRGVGEQFIKIPDKAQKLNLNLKVPQNAKGFSKYRVVVNNADGETVFRAENLKVPRLSLSTIVFESRVYLISLEGLTNDNQSESIADYVFRVYR